MRVNTTQRFGKTNENPGSGSGSSSGGSTNVISAEASVQTLEPDQRATVSASFNALTGLLTFLFGIPKGAPGEKGDDGIGIASISKTETSGLTDTYTITYTDGTTDTITVTNGAKGDPGDTGNGIAQVDITYGQSNSINSIPSDWYESQGSLAPTAYAYIWTRRVMTYTDGTTTTDYSVSYSTYITDISYTYGVSASAETYPTTWYNSGGTGIRPQQGEWYWVREAISRRTGEMIRINYAYIKTYIGEDGTGIGSITVAYAASTSGTTPPDTGWQNSIPTVAQGQYLWTRFTMPYNIPGNQAPLEPLVTYTVSYQGQDGQAAYDLADEEDDGLLRHLRSEPSVQLASYLRGDNTWQTLNKAAVSLNNVDNTADVDKPISTAVQNALDTIIEEYSTGGHAQTLGHYEDTTLNTTADVDGFTSDYMMFAICEDDASPIGDDGMILWIPYDANYGQQFYLNDTGTQIYHRFCNNGDWGSWKRIYDDEYHPSADVATRASILREEDNRSYNWSPSWYMTVIKLGVYTEFKTPSVIGLNSIITGNYASIATIIPWTDASGGYPIQIAFDVTSGKGLAWRIGLSNDTWGSWVRMHDDNYHVDLSNCIQRYGSNASIVDPASDLNNFGLGLALFTGNVANNPFNGWCMVISTNDLSGTAIQVAYELWNNLAVKIRNCAAGTWSSWKDLCVNDSTKLPLTGGNITGNLTVNNNNVWHAGNLSFSLSGTTLTITTS